MIISQQRQRQSLRNYLAGHELGLETDWLDDDHYFIYEVITDLRQAHRFDEYRIQAELSRHALSDAALKECVEAMLALSPRERPPAYLNLHDIGQNLPEITWLWPHWIPRGLLTALAAEPGVGKTNMALDLSRRVIHRLLAPDGRQPLNIRNGGNVIYIEAENFRAGLYERARAWDVNMSRLYLFPQTDSQDADLLNLADPATQDDLRDMCFDLRPDLIIIDSFSTVQIKSENSIEDTRDVLRFFGQLATHYNCAVVLLHHLRKPQRESNYNNVSQHDLRGSSHLAAMARTIIGMWTTSKSNSGPRRIQVIKSNIGPYPPPLNLVYHTAGSVLFDMRFEEMEEPDLPEKTLTGQCAEWLREVLSAGPMSYGDLKEMAAEAGFSESTLQRARKLLDWQIVDTLGPRITGNEWEFVAQNGKNGADMQDMRMSDTPPSNFLPPPVGHAACVHVRQAKIHKTHRRHPLFFKEHPLFYRNGRGPLPGGNRQQRHGPGRRPKRR